MARDSVIFTDIVLQEIKQPIAAGKVASFRLSGSGVRVAECWGEVVIDLMRDGRIVGSSVFEAGGYYEGHDFDEIAVKSDIDQEVKILIYRGKTGVISADRKKSQEAPKNYYLQTLAVNAPGAYGYVEIHNQPDSSVTVYVDKISSVCPIHQGLSEEQKSEFTAIIAYVAMGYAGNALDGYYSKSYQSDNNYSMSEARCRYGVRSSINDILGVTTRFVEPIIFTPSAQRHENKLSQAMALPPGYSMVIITYDKQLYGTYEFHEI